MKKPVLLVTILALSESVASAGPNVNGTLTVQGNVAGVDTGGDPCAAIPVPGSCEDTQPTAQPDANNVEWFIVVAAGSSPLSFNTVTFGLGSYNNEACYIGFHGPCHAELAPLEIPSAGWPGPNSGTSVSWAPTCLEGMLVPIYYFGVYVYAPGVVPLGDEYPNQPAAFVSCDSPPQEDVIAGFGAFGCGGAQGQVVCPEIVPPPTGACCIGVDCFVLTEDECLSQGGEFFGGPCDPSPCPPLVGACCVDGDGDEIPETCIITDLDDCLAQGGEYQGDGTDCVPNPCPTLPLGACCVDRDGDHIPEWCIIATEDDCSAQGGEYQGDGTNCLPPSPCPIPQDCPQFVGIRSDAETPAAANLGFTGDATTEEAPAPDSGGQLFCNWDGTVENAYCWLYDGSVRPDYGAWAECYEADFVLEAQFYFTQIGYYVGQCFDVYVWSDDAGNPGNVICAALDQKPGPIAYWPSCSVHQVQLMCHIGYQSHFIGFWGIWPGNQCGWYVCSDEDGPGGCPRTKIAPGIGYPTGWQHPSIVPAFGAVRSIGICEWADDAPPVRTEARTWGQIKALYR